MRSRAAGVLIAAECGLLHADLADLHDFGTTLVVAPRELMDPLVELLEGAARR